MQLVVELYSLSGAVDNNKTYSVSENSHKRQFHQRESINIACWHPD